MVLDPAAEIGVEAVDVMDQPMELPEQAAHGGVQRLFEEVQAPRLPQRR
jgi:hypothetical protein